MDNVWHTLFKGGPFANAFNAIHSHVPLLNYIKVIASIKMAEAEKGFRGTERGETDEDTDASTLIKNIIAVSVTIH